MLQNYSYNISVEHYNRMISIVKTRKFKKKCLKSPVIFYKITSFLDDDTLFECKYVIVFLIIFKVFKSSRQLIKKEVKLENITLKLELKKVRLIVFVGPYN